VSDDPRLQKSDAVRVAQRAMLERLRQSSNKLLQATDRLSESEETLTKIKTELGDTEGATYDSLRKRTTAMTDSIKAIRDFIAGKRSEKQGLSASPQATVLNRIQDAQIYILSKRVTPGAQEETLVRNAETEIAQALQRVNAFYSGPWKTYRQQIESGKINPFKDYNPIQ